MEIHELVRRKVRREGKSKRQVARELGLARGSVDKMLLHPLPPGYRLSNPRPKPVLGPFMEKIRELVKADEGEPVRQRKTAQNILATLRNEFGYTGGYSQVKAYIAELRQKPEAFVPLVHAPGEAQIDFGEAVAEIAGVRAKVHFFTVVLPHSGVWFQAAYPAENGECFEDGHARAFEFFGGAAAACV